MEEENGEWGMGNECYEYGISIFTCVFDLCVLSE